MSYTFITRSQHFFTYKAKHITFKDMHFLDASCIELKYIENFNEVFRTDHTVTMCAEVTLLLSSHLTQTFCILQKAGKAAAFTQKPPEEIIQLAFELSLCYPLHRDMMPILVIVKRKINVALGKRVFQRA